MKKLISKVRNSKLAKYLSVTMAVAIVAAMSCFSCFAEGEATIQSELTTAFSSVATQLTNYAIIGIRPITPRHAELKKPW